MEKVIAENGTEKELAIFLCKEKMISMIEQMNDLTTVGELYETVVFYYNRAK